MSPIARPATLLTALIVAAVCVASTLAACQVVCNQQKENGQCGDASIKCFTNMPNGYTCLSFVNSVPPFCTDMVPNQRHLLAREAAAAAGGSSVPSAPSAEDKDNDDLVIKRITSRRRRS